MRIVAGQYGGRRIIAPKGSRTRPTSDRVREALFSHLDAAILNNGFDGLHVLDLYAGSGGLGLEALSRGAATATFVESARAAQAAIRNNIEVLGCNDRARLHRGRLPGELRRLPRPATAACAWDLVFCDPPWADEPYRDVLAGLLEHDCVRSSGVVVLEHAVTSAIDLPEEWTELSVRVWGGTAVLVSVCSR